MLILKPNNSWFKWKLNDGMIGHFKAAAIFQSKNQYFILGDPVLACSVLKNKYLFYFPDYFFLPFFSKDEFFLFRFGTSLITEKITKDINSKRYTDVKLCIEEIDALSLFELTEETFYKHASDLLCEIDYGNS